MGAGKTTIGARLAQRLGWRFIDFDEEIVRRAGMSIADIFRTHGEMAFRDMEQRLTAELSCVTDAVLAPGGGWIMRPGALESLPPAARVVWLRVTPEEAVRRVRESDVERPLLAGPDPLAAARQLLAQREPLYGRADLIVDADEATPDDITQRIVAFLELENHGDWKKG
jgi:shikimate kinase